MRRLAEREREGACEVRHAELHERAQVGDQQPVRDIAIDVFAYLARLPGEQPPSLIGRRRRRFAGDLPFEQR
ncbi:MAG: hypothetical protein ACYDAE_15710, partial [Steroidobacteraceae bacterium]